MKFAVSKWRTSWRSGGERMGYRSALLVWTCRPILAKFARRTSTFASCRTMDGPSRCFASTADIFTPNTTNNRPIWWTAIWFRLRGTIITWPDQRQLDENLNILFKFFVWCTCMTCRWIRCHFSYQEIYFSKFYCFLFSRCGATIDLIFTAIACFCEIDIWAASDVIALKLV